MSLDCHKKVELTCYMAPLNPTTDIATKLSPRKYWPSRDSDNLPSLSCNKLSMSDCFWNAKSQGQKELFNVAWLSQKSWAAKLHATFKSCNRYRNQTISKQVLTIARYFDSADDLDTFVCFFNFHVIINAIPRYWSPSCLTTSPIWVAISCQCQIVFETQNPSDNRIDSALLKELFNTLFPSE